MQRSTRALPAGFATYHNPRLTLVAVYSAHVAYPSVLLAIIYLLAAPDPSRLFSIILSSVAFASSIALASSLYVTRRTGASRVWRNGERLEASVVGVEDRENEVILRVRFEVGGFTQIGLVAVLPGDETAFQPADLVELAYLPGYAPLYLQSPAERFLQTAT